MSRTRARGPWDNDSVLLTELLVFHVPVASENGIFAGSFPPVDWEDIKEEIVNQLREFWSDTPDSVLASIDAGIDWAKESSSLDYVLTLYHLPSMALAFPALFDMVVGQIINEGSYQQSGGESRTLTTREGH